MIRHINVELKVPEVDWKRSLVLKLLRQLCQILKDQPMPTVNWHLFVEPNPRGKTKLAMKACRKASNIIKRVQKAGKQSLTGEWEEYKM